MRARLSSCGSVFCPQSSPCHGGAHAWTRSSLRPSLPEKVQTARTEDPRISDVFQRPCSVCTCACLSQTARVGNPSTPPSATVVGPGGLLGFGSPPLAVSFWGQSAGHPEPGSIPCPSSYCCPVFLCSRPCHVVRCCLPPLYVSATAGVRAAGSCRSLGTSMRLDAFDLPVVRRSTGCPALTFACNGGSYHRDADRRSAGLSMPGHPPAAACW